MIVRNDLHSKLNLLMAFIFETFSIAILAGVDTFTRIVVLRWRRRGPKVSRSVSRITVLEVCAGLPVTICWHNIIDS